MNTKSMILRFAVSALFAVGTVSCMTSYDQHGRPMQTVDPAVAVAGAAAAGLVAYSIANNRSDRRYHHNHHHHYRHHNYGHQGGRHYRRY